MAAGSYADINQYRQNSKYCRVSNSSDPLCKNRKSWATKAQALALARDKASENWIKYCQLDSSAGDPLCAPKWKTDASAGYEVDEYEDPVYE